MILYGKAIYTLALQEATYFNLARISIIQSFKHHHRVPKSLGIVRMKHQRPDLDTLPRLLCLRCRVHKGRMRHPPCSAIRLRIKTFDQGYLIRPLPVQKVPLVLLVRQDRECLPDSIRVDELHGHKIAVGDGICVSNAERIFEDGFDGPPDIDDLEATFE